MLRYREQERESRTVWARRAHQIALGTWALAACAPGLAAVLSDYALLTDADPTRLNAAALIILWVGLGGTLLGWFCWAFISSLLFLANNQASFLIANSQARSHRSMKHSPIFLLLWISVMGVGGFMTVAGGSSTLLSPIPVIALGLGVTCFVGGTIGMFRFLLAPSLRDLMYRAANWMYSCVAKNQRGM
jgi:hypothetical protein